MGARSMDGMRGKDDVWADWLADEPLPDVATDRPARPADRSAPVTVRERLRRAGLAEGAAPVAAQAAPGVAAAPGVTIQVKLPASWRRPRWLAKKPSLRTVRYWAVFAVIVFGGGLLLRLGVYGVMTKLHKTGSTAGDSAVTAVAKPSFSPLVPKDKKELATPGASAHYDDSKKLYSYNDTVIGGAAVTVSQQAVPESFTSNPASVLSAANSINATAHIDTALGMMYIATDSKTGIQRAMLPYKDRLIFLQSDKKIDDDAWKYYVESLR